MVKPCSKVFVFDLDDTLYPEKDFARSGFQAVGKWVKATTGIDGFGDRAWELFARGERKTIFNQVAANMLGTECPDRIGQMVQVFRSHTPRINLFPDAERILSHCQSLNPTGIALITDGFLETQQNKISALKLNERFDLIIATDQWGREFWKPHPRAYITVESFFKVEPENCCYVADNPSKDFIIPRQRGWLSVRICRTGGEYNRVNPGDTDADFQCSSLDELRLHRFFATAG